MQQTCEYCRRQFDAVKPRRTCSKPCAARITYQAKGRVWPPDAEEWLESQVGSVPLARLIDEYHQIAPGKGWPPRTSVSIQTKVQRLGLSQRCTLDNVTRAELGRLLGISHSRVRTWTRTGLRCQKISHSHTAIRVRDVKAYLLKHPNRAVGVDRDALAWLIGDDPTRRILESITLDRVPGLPRPIINLTTGKRYPNVYAAAREIYVAKSGICKAIRRNGTSLGQRWAYLDEMEDKKA